MRKFSDVELADYRINVLRNVASEGAQAREVVAVIHQWFLYKSYATFYHNVQAKGLYEVLLRWGYDIMSMTRKDMDNLRRRAGYIK